MNLIVNVDKNWAIGLGSKLLVRIPQDMKYFRSMTTGHVVVMGRKTLESFPESKPLPNRVNIVLTRDQGYQAPGAVVVHSMEELKEELKKYSGEEIFVIGGGQIYRELLPLCDKAYVTKVDRAFDADVYFPDLDQDPQWKMTKVSEEQTYFDLEYVFAVYERTA
ncbi:MAG: dihydrofolate reductase [Massilistercora timonensis]|uniref:dihydrofolate reductase n=1 Tax=Massilistercora timonensis TaxID=2086584 RepID=UPI000D0E4150|nr:dihydrofolate reductase [Massilistercora timonensis]